jgi:hypothetical protein
MKTATYRGLDGKDFTVEYDENAPCIVCQEPVVEASMGGTGVCPWCDCGHCRYCGIDMMVMGEHVDGGRSLRMWREHMKWHKDNPVEAAAQVPGAPA